MDEIVKIHILNSNKSLYKANNLWMTVYQNKMTTMLDWTWAKIIIRTTIQTKAF